MEAVAQDDPSDSGPSKIGSLRDQLRIRPVIASAIATGIAGIAVLLIARITGADAVGRAFDHFDPRWIGLIAGAELLAYPAYVLAYRTLANMHGRSVALPLVARVVVAGFGPFALGGGFGIDKKFLHTIHQDEGSARVTVIALGVLEWAVLAPLTCVVATSVLIGLPGSAL